MWYVYIVRCSDGCLYTGITDNLEQRLHEHNSCKRGAKFIKYRRPVKLAYREPIEDKKQAAKREKEIKGWRREKKDALIRAMRVPLDLSVSG
ncbi:MAG: GIY-YIG nuclease family protein [Candidatus Omnitrophica bacterium]|nr:GIY-YIG nuclease family protein [Candidatus Omnitrophota bacterium]